MTNGHVDAWIKDMGWDDKPEDGDIIYARWLMMHWRLPDYMTVNFRRFITGRQLFCTYEEQRYRCTGGSRLGDVFLTANFEQAVGYEKRVEVGKCKQWSEKP